MENSVEERGLHNLELSVSFKRKRQKVNVTSGNCGLAQRRQVYFV